MGQVVVLTSGEYYSNYSIDTIICVPSLCWLVSKMDEYRRYRDRDKTIAFGRGSKASYKYQPDEFFRNHYFISDRHVAYRKKFDQWLVLKYADEVSRQTSVQVLHFED